MLSDLKKLKLSWPTIALLIFVVVFSAFPTIFWPGGFGIGKDKSVTTTTVETVKKDKQGNLVKTVEITAYNDGKTLWDWLSLLGVPLTLVILGYLLQQEQQKRADNEAKEEILQTYFDRLSVVLSDKNLTVLTNKSNSSSNKIEPEEQELLDSSLNLIRARTFSILRRFEQDLDRQTSVIRFLIDSDIHGKFKLDLTEFDLTKVNLSGVNLTGSDLRDANFSGVNLTASDLSGVNLTRSDLTGANLTETNLSRARLTHATLTKAQLSMAQLGHANLSMANLSGANLSMADLSGANLSMADLSGADLTGAKLLGTNLSKAILTKVQFGYANSLMTTELEQITWDPETLWPNKSQFSEVKYIPESLKKELNI